jgi:hypothetical protein
MSKQAGLGDGLVIDGIDISGDTGSLGSIGSSRPTTGVTGIDKFAQERIHLIRSGRIEWQSWFNPARAHPELSSLPTSDRIVTYLRGRTLGNPAAGMVAKQINYDPNRNIDGSLNAGVQAQSNGYGLEWGKQLTAGLLTVAAPGSQLGADFGAQTLFGLQAYLQVLDVQGGDLDVHLEDSSTSSGSGFSVFSSALDFPTFNAPGASRIQSARDATVRRWVRVNYTGTFTSATLLVVVVKNTHEVLF